MSNRNMSSAQASHTREDLIREAVANMGAMVRVFHRNFRQPREVDIFELTMPQCRAVLYLQEGPVPMSKLAAGLGVSLPSATGIIDRLVERGLVSREEDSEDRRLVLCALTAEGQRMATSLFEADVAVLEGLLLTLSDEELLTVLRAQKVLLGAASRAAELRAQPGAVTTAQMKKS